ncbi:MAG: DUF5081 family protein [Cellulophaga sp.]|nr:DUF5081 family protein [Cellulophaga sp.]
MPVSFVIILVSLSLYCVLGIYFRMEHVKNKKAHLIRVHKYLIDLEFYTREINKRETNLNKYNFLNYNLKEALHPC